MAKKPDGLKTKSGIAKLYRYRYCLPVIKRMLFCVCDMNRCYFVVVGFFGSIAVCASCGRPTEVPNATTATRTVIPTNETMRQPQQTLNEADHKQQDPQQQQ